MRDLVGEESIVLDGRFCRLSVVSAERIIAAELRQAGGAAAATTPVIAIAGKQTCGFDLARLPADGDFEILLHTVGEVVRFGSQSVRNAKLLAGQIPGDKRRKRPIVHTAFDPGGSGSRHALVYVDLDSQSLRLRVSLTDDITSFLSVEEAAPRPRQRGEPAGAARPGNLKFSVISPVYNVEKYLDEFFESLTGQALFRKSVELIMVDDGSTDRSARIIKRWQRKFPENIVYVLVEHGGIVGARNAGLARAAHDWITFVDPDDFVAPGYFEQAQATILRHGEASTAAVSCSIVHYYEATRTEIDGHPLRYRFAEGERSAPVDNLGRDFQITVCGVFWRKDVIAANRLAFDPRVRPSSEDAHFVGRYFLKTPGKALIFQPAARYFHRRRGDQSSLTQTAWMKPGSYDDELRFGYLDLLRQGRDIAGRVPAHIQNMVLYCLSWTLRRVIDEPGTAASLDEAQRARYIELLRETFNSIDAGTIAAYDISLSFMHRVGILGFFKNADPPNQIVEVTDLDAAKAQIRVIHWSRHEQPRQEFLIDGAPVTPVAGKARRIDLVGRPFVFEHIGWLAVGGGKTLRARIDGRDAAIQVGGRRYENGAPLAEIRPALLLPVPSEAMLPEHIRMVRQAALASAAATTFRDAWLFMDRDSEADDSAEFLYRHVREHAPEINAFFILQRGSPHWERLARDDFRLIAFHEPAHATALLNASHLISSQADHYVIGYLGKAEFGDRLRYKFVFLQHGVTQADYADWFNQRQIDLLATSSDAEYRSIVADGSRYKLTAKEVVLTGLPRHDALLRARRDDGRTLVLMPTWRSWLTGQAKGPGNARAAHPDFTGSDFAKRWKSLLHEPALSELAARYDHRIVFVPHPNLEQYAHFFAPPPPIEWRSFGDGGSIQDLFGGLSLFVTDFSSKAFDAGFLDKPVIYYQFDADTFFGGAHSGRPGYFDYARDGFGPVVQSEDDVLAAIETVLSGTAPDPVYAARAAATFPFRDGRACERVLAAIRNLGAPAADIAVPAARAGAR